MKYLPFENFEIHTELSSEEVFYRLRASVDTQGKWWIFTNKPFWGKVYRHHFRIWRDTWWGRNFTPVTFGTIQEEDLGTCIRVRMRMPWHGFLFYSFILGFIWLSLFMGHASVIVQKLQTGTWYYESIGEWLLNVVLGVLFLVFAYLISVGTFKSDVRKVKTRLLWITQATEENVLYRDQLLGLRESQIIGVIFIIPIVISVGWMIYKLLL